MEKLPLPLQGDVLLCEVCGFMQQSDPTVESGWMQRVVDGTAQAICPRCFGGEYTPQCGVCQRFYHPEYDRCPWCTA